MRVPVKLVFFMSRATSLARWHERGMWPRETAIYRHLSQQLIGLSILTPGDKRDQHFNPSENITILNNPRRTSANIYSLTALWRHRHALRRADLYKTNQMDGAWTAVLAGLVYRKPVIVRAGYLWAKYELDLNGDSVRYRIYRALSAFSFRYATHIFLTTAQMKTEVVKSYGIPAKKITIMPNYVDTTMFRSLPGVATVPGRIVFVGRLNDVKNLDLLIEGMAQARSDLHGVFAGSGELKPELKALAQRRGIDVEFLGNQPNDKLPEIVNSASVFALVSKFEGHPKVLIEAMACKVPVLGSRVPGIKEIINDGENGRLCEPDPADIAKILDEMMADSSQREMLAQNGYLYSTDAFGLNHLVQSEIERYVQLTNKL
ncbi:MAG: glycosyltransferase family 4 protein [Chloroflexota bacterium]